MAVDTEQHTQRKTKLNLWDTTSLIVGVVIGVGIFLTPASVFRNVNGPWQAMGLWVLGGLFSLIGALCFAELSSTYPRSGGEYVYLTRSFGGLVGFLFAWVQLTVIRTAGTTSGIAYAFGSFGCDFFGVKNSPVSAAGLQTTNNVLFSCALGAGAIALFTVVNVLGVVFGKWTQNFLTALKVLGIGGLLLTGLVLAQSMGGPQQQNIYSAQVVGTVGDQLVFGLKNQEERMVKLGADTKVIIDNDEMKITGGAKQVREELQGKVVRVTVNPEHPGVAELIRANTMPLIAMIAIGLIPVLWTYMGWHEAAYVVAEVREERRTIPLALMLGTGLVLVIYLAVNAAFLNGLGFERAGESRTISAELLGLVFGNEGGQVMALLIMISCLGAINGTIFTSSRIYVEIGIDHPLFAALGTWNERWGTPVRSLLVQGTLSLVMLVFISLFFKLMVPEKWVPADEDPFDALLFCTSAPFWIFFLLTGLSLFVLRFKDKNVVRPFRVPFYPVVPMLFCLMCVYMAYSSITYKPWHSLVGLGLLALGLPFYFLSESMRRKMPPGEKKPGA